MKKITESVKGGRILLSDGAWGTMLFSKGLQPGECPELWNVTHRSEVLDLARSYIDAGSDIIQTNSFGANRIKLAHYGLVNRATELNEAAAAISREAVGADKLVFGSIGPTGKLLLLGDVTADELVDAFREQATGLQAGGVDALCLETFIDIDEAVLAIETARMFTDLELACTFTFDKTVSGEYRTFMANTVEQVVRMLVSEGVDIIGTNCGNRIDGMIEIVRQIRELEPDLPILVHANAGVPTVDGTAVSYPDSPEIMASRVAELVEAGANIIGGCCGTTPDHIRAMRQALAGISA